MQDDKGASQSGGVNISGGTVTAKNIVGHDQTINNGITPAQLAEIFRPLRDAMNGAAPGVQQVAAHKVEELQNEAAKGKGASDSVMAKLVEGITALVPSAVGAIVSAFGTPLLGGIAGPVTKYVLNKITSNDQGAS